MDDDSNNNSNWPLNRTEGDSFDVMTNADDLLVVVGESFSPTDCCQPPRGHQLGGPNAVIIADIFIDPATEFPILYLADTVTIPTHYHLHALDFERCSQPPAAVALTEMCKLSDAIIRTGSFLVLGPRLQHWISAEALHVHIGHLVPAVIPFDTLRRFDRQSESTFDVADNFEEMSRWATRVCCIACSLASRPTDSDRVLERPEQLERLQCLLGIANVLSAQQLVLWSCNEVYISAF